jgi:DNA-binding transcriptional MerR regulator
VPGNALPDKLFFKIGEVAQIVGVRAHVLRYWESEFASLRPLKTRGSHRVYRRRDVELAVLLRRLLHEEGLTIAGAKRRLRDLGRGAVSMPTDATDTPREEASSALVVARDNDARAELVAMRAELYGLLSALDTVVQVEGDPVEQPVTEVSADGRSRSGGAGIIDRSGR